MKRKDVNAVIRAARLLDPCIILGCPMCTGWSSGVSPSTLSWGGMPATTAVQDRHQRAGREFLKHLQSAHGVVLGGLERHHMPIIVDSPLTRATQTVWLANTIVGELVVSQDQGGGWD